MKAIDERFEADVADGFNYKSNIEARSAKDGTSLSSVLHQIKVIKAIL
jgi:argininosuccinate lyase